MIKKISQITQTELDTISDIWLTANKEAHEFISESYWDHNYAEVKKMLPEADLYLYYMEEEIVGFMGIMDDYIAGIFIKSSYRGKGIGKCLIKEAKGDYEKLELAVYKRNDAAYQFYIQQGFIVSVEQLEEENNEVEYIMTWTKNE